MQAGLAVLHAGCRVFTPEGKTAGRTTETDLSGPLALPRGLPACGLEQGLQVQESGVMSSARSETKGLLLGGQQPGVSP